MPHQFANAIGLASLVSLTSCGSTVDTSSDDWLVKGHVERVTGGGHTFDGPVSFGPHSEARISLYSTQALGGDGTATMVAEQRLSPAPTPPFDFVITGPRSGIADKSLAFYVSAQLSQTPGADTVGDLLDEELTVVKPPIDGVMIPVTGLEACSSPNAGGFCAN